MTNIFILLFASITCLQYNKWQKNSHNYQKEIFIHV